MNQAVKWLKPDGMVLQCIQCRAVEVLPWHDAMRVPDPPRCPDCRVPLVCIRGHWRTSL